MSPLARMMYEVLRRRVGEMADPRITYSELAEQLCANEAFDGLHRRSPELYAALREVGAECRRLGLPPLPALVVRADTRRPGSAYYAGKCSGTRPRGDAVEAWRRDLEAVKQAVYPPAAGGRAGD
jgi:hypothetical protein